MRLSAKPRMELRNQHTSNFIIGKKRVWELIPFDVTIPERTRHCSYGLRVQLGSWGPTMSSRHAIPHNKNHLAETAVTNINNKGHTLTYSAHVPEDMKQKLFRDAWLTTVKLDGLSLSLSKARRKPGMNIFLAQIQLTLNTFICGVKLALSNGRH